VALTADELRALLGKRRASPFCREHDLVDPIALLIATGLRRSELLALRWSDFDAEAGTVTVTGKLVRVTGKGLARMDETKTAAGRTLPLPRFAVDMLRARRAVPYIGEQSVIFASTAGTLRDPNNFGKQWRTVRERLGVPGVTTHSFRKTVATLIDDEGLSARIDADHLGHSKVSMNTGPVHVSRPREASSKSVGRGFEPRPPHVRAHFSRSDALSRRYSSFMVRSSSSATWVCTLGNAEQQA
jgi:integrase